MSWGEIKNAVNSNLKVPLNEIVVNHTHERTATINDFALAPSDTMTMIRAGEVSSYDRSQVLAASVRIHRGGIVRVAFEVRNSSGQSGVGRVNLDGSTVFSGSSSSSSYVACTGDIVVKKDQLLEFTVSGTSKDTGGIIKNMKIGAVKTYEISQKYASDSTDFSTINATRSVSSPEPLSLAPPEPTTAQIMQSLNDLRADLEIAGII